MNRLKLSSFAFAAVFLAGAGPSLADIFSYKDERGVVHFTNMPNGDKRFKLVRKEEGSRSNGMASIGPARMSQLFMPAQADILRFSSIIDAASKTYGVDNALVHAVITAESGYNPSAVSKAGARGLMQLMPGTAARYGVQNIHDPRENIVGGVRYLRDLITMFNGNLELAVAAYNAGENAVIRYGNKIPPYAETVHYVPKVLGFYRKFQARS
ncbi:MAG TPA: transglycosylase SLT domain-containing protein [Usitatibacter sp.]|nr:transglycosylase SLT domain-containing protein [Usitatibacter sp.]